MKIGIYVAKVGVRPGFERIVSGHVQVPLHSARLLQEAGHEVGLITTHVPQDRVLPECMPRDLSLHETPDASLQGAEEISRVGKIDGVRPWRLLNLVGQINLLARRRKFDVLHLFGGNRTANLAGAIRFSQPGCPVVMTANAAEFPEPHFRYTKHLWRKVDRIISATEFFKNELARLGIEATMVHNGAMRNLRDEMPPAGPRGLHRVVFWREATPRNGGETAVKVVGELARRHPSVEFDFALRPHWNNHRGVAELCASLPNVHRYEAPYPAGMSLGRLLAEAICVFQPFRASSFQPQLTILESLLAGVPVVASDAHAFAEIVDHGRSGLIARRDDVDGFVAAVDSLIRQPELTAKLRQDASAITEAKWNWNNYVNELERIYSQVQA